jgi:hypothetical protein
MVGCCLLWHDKQVTDPCSGVEVGRTTTVTVTCSNRLPVENVTVEWEWSPTTPTQLRLVGKYVKITPVPATNLSPRSACWLACPLLI